MCVSGYMPKKIRVGRSENLFFFLTNSDQCHDHHALSRHRLENHDIVIDL